VIRLKAILACVQGVGHAYWTYSKKCTHDASIWIQNNRYAVMENLKKSDIHVVDMEII